MKKLSIVVPCYNEEETIKYFYDAVDNISKIMKYHFEIIFVNDGSKDKTEKILKDYANNDKRVKYINFSRNFGKEAAMYAGLSYATGDFITIMDADLQDPPELLPEMCKILESGYYDIVGTRRVTRKGEPPIRSFFARRFYKLINKLSKVEMVDGARDFRLMKKMVVKSILSLGEYNRYSKGLFSFVGYRTKWLEYDNLPRVAGETKWSFWKLVLYAIDGIVAFSTVPLVISIFFGIILFIAFLVTLIITLVNNLGITYHLMWIIFLISSLLFIMLGIIGEYLSKTYLEVKNRPIYFVRSSNIGALDD